MTAVLVLALLLEGCAPTGQRAANLWDAHYQGQRLQPLAQEQTVEVSAARFEDVYGQPPAGWSRLGTSVFFEDFDLKDHGLDLFARSIGASRVLWVSHSMGQVSYQSSYHVPVTEASRTTGRVKEPGGASHEVDLTTKTQRWETRTGVSSKEEFSHHAAFLAPAPR